MNIKRNDLIMIGLLLVTAVSVSPAQNLGPMEAFQRPGVQWLSWTARERESFVYGYIHGYAHGMSAACLTADNLFEKDKSHTMGHDDVSSTYPSARCRRSVAQYPLIEFSPTTGPDFSPYTSAITEFYTKHPEYRDTSFIRLMDFFAGSKRLTGDDLYSKLVGKSPAPSK